MQVLPLSGAHLPLRFGLPRSRSAELRWPSIDVRSDHLRVQGPEHLRSDVDGAVLCGSHRPAEEEARVAFGPFF